VKIIQSLAPCPLARWVLRMPWADVARFLQERTSPS